MIIHDIDGADDGDRSLIKTIIVNIVGEFVTAIGPVANGLAGQAFAIIQQGVEIQGQTIGTMFLDQGDKGPFTDIAGRQLSRQIAEQHIRQAHIFSQQSEQGTVLSPGGIQFQWRDAQAFLEYLG